VAGKHRLVTRSDFDGLVCAALLKELGMIDDILFVHPKDMQDGKVPMKPGDITTNLPYVDGCHLVFDHHESEIVRLGTKRPANQIIDRRRLQRRAWCLTILAARGSFAPSRRK
jgi:hypothetical protein